MATIIVSSSIVSMYSTRPLATKSCHLDICEVIHVKRRNRFTSSPFCFVPTFDGLIIMLWVFGLGSFGDLWDKTRTRTKPIAIVLTISDKKCIYLCCKSACWFSQDIVYAVQSIMTHLIFYPKWFISLSFSKSMCFRFNNSFWSSTIRSGLHILPASVLIRISLSRISLTIDTYSKEITSYYKTILFQQRKFGSNTDQIKSPVHCSIVSTLHLLNTYLSCIDIFISTFISTSVNNSKY